MLNCEITCDHFKKHPVGNYNRVTLFSSPLSTLKITSSEFVYIAMNKTSNAGRGAQAPKERGARFPVAQPSVEGCLLTDAHTEEVRGVGFSACSVLALDQAVLVRRERP